MAHVTFFAFDITEAAQIRRIESVRSLGHDVQSFSFRRENMNRGFAPDWPNVDLGRTENGRLVRRLGSVFRGIVRSVRHRDRLSGSGVWIARNLDQLAIAWAVRLATGRRNVSLVYECLDIHDVMTRKDAIGAAARWAERRLLARCDLLILSSEGFLRAYFRPLQRVGCPVALIENKLWIGHALLSRPSAPRNADGPLVLGWVGSLRCPRSLELLSEVARRMGEDIRIVFRGSIHRHALSDIDRVLREHPNITYGGTYDYPDGLAGVYGACDLVWSQDLWQAGGNSDWLLPNRIYEASYFGCPSIAVGSTETGRRIQSDGLGFTVERPDAEDLTALLRQLDREEIRAASRRILAKPDAAFRLFREELAEKLAPVLGAGRTPGRVESLPDLTPEVRHP